MSIQVLRGGEREIVPLSLEVRELDVSELTSREEGSSREVGSRALNKS
jgi:hypothetical protein